MNIESEMVVFAAIIIFVALGIELLAYAGWAGLKTMGGKDEIDLFYGSHFICLAFCAASIISPSHSPLLPWIALFFGAAYIIICYVMIAAANQHFNVTERAWVYCKRGNRNNPGG